MEENVEVENVISEECAAKSDVEKRERKLTVKGVSLLLENLQKNWKLSFNQASKIKLKIGNLVSAKITTNTVCNVENLF